MGVSKCNGNCERVRQGSLQYEKLTRKNYVLLRQSIKDPFVSFKLIHSFGKSHKICQVELHRYAIEIQSYDVSLIAALVH